MNIHEHQGKELLRKYGVAVPDGVACFTVDEAVAAAEKLGFPCVVKAQIHVGGRGKAGGVKVVKSAAEVHVAYAYPVKPRSPAIALMRALCHGSETRKAVESDRRCNSSAAASMLSNVVLPIGRATIASSGTRDGCV